MQTVSIPAYEFNELSDAARAVAREGLVDSAFAGEWWESVVEDADAIARHLGIKIDRLCHAGRLSRSPDIRFSGFSQQGSGASFTGHFEARAQVSVTVRDYAPMDSELHSIADELAMLYPRLPSACRLVIRRRKSCYVHEYTTFVEASELFADTVPSELLESFEALSKRFMRWIYSQLERESNYLRSEDAVTDLAESLQCRFSARGEDVTRFVEDASVASPN